MTLCTRLLLSLAHPYCNVLDLGASEVYVAADYFSQIARNYWLSDVGCNGLESTLLDCSNAFLTQHTCQESHPLAAISCYGQ